MVMMDSTVLLSHTGHILGGFGAAVLLQHYMRGNSVVPVLLGWAFVAYGAIMTTLEFMDKL